MIDHACICRECGALVGLESFVDRGGLCARCAFPVRTKFRPVDVTAADLREPGNVTTFKPDPIREAIDRATASWANDNPEDPQ